MISLENYQTPVKMIQETTFFTYEDEELQDFLYGKFKIIQKKDGYRFSVDPILLAAFIELKKGSRIIDLGTGSGIIPLTLADRLEDSQIVGLEVQEAYADMAARSVKLNQREELIQIQQADIREIKTLFPPESFNIAVSNPPYLPVDTGHLNPNQDKAIARHELAGTLVDFIEAARYLIKQKGSAYFIMPAARATDLFDSLRSSKLEPRRVRFIHANEHSQAKLVMIEAIKNAKPESKILRPLFVYNLEGRYTDEVEGILRNGHPRD